MKTLDINNDDIWAAVRGLGMYGMSVAELDALIDQHIHNDLFASRVILRAACQVRSCKRATGRECGE